MCAPNSSSGAVPGPGFGRGQPGWWEWLLLGGLYFFIAALGPRKTEGGMTEPSRVALNTEHRKLSDDIGEQEKKY